MRILIARVCIGHKNAPVVWRRRVSDVELDVIRREVAERGRLHRDRDVLRPEACVSRAVVLLGRDGVLPNPVAGEVAADASRAGIAAETALPRTVVERDVDAVVARTVRGDA